MAQVPATGAGSRGWPLALLAAAAIAAQAQTPPGSGEPPIFTEEIRVEVVELEVIVTDRDGKPVTGLGEQDFEVRLDGEPVEITNFYAVDAATAGGAPETAGEAAIAALDPRLRMAIVVDSRTLPFGRAKSVLEDVAAGVMGRLRAGDEVLVASIDRSFEVRQQLTADRQAAAGALRSVAGATAGIGTGEREMRRIAQDLAQITPPAATGAAGAEGFGGLISAQADQAVVEAQARELRQSISTYAEQRYFEAQSTAQVLERLVDHMGGLPGRKVVLYVGGGIEERPGEALLSAWTDKFSNPAYGVRVGGEDRLPPDRDVLRLFSSVGERANAAGVVFYALAPDSDLRMLGISAEIGSVSFADRQNAAANAGAAFDLSRGGPLYTLAATTGGTARVGGSDLEGFLGQIQRDGGAFYSLGLRLTRTAAEDEKHQVKVRVHRPKLRVRHRETVRPRTAVEKAEAATLATLVHGGGQNDLGVAVEFGAAQADGEGMLLLPMTVRFPLVRLVLVPQGEQHVGQATLLMAAMDEREDLSSMQTAELPIRVPTADLVGALQRLAQYEAKLRIRPGRHRIAIGLHDQVGDTTSTVVVEHDVAPASGG